MTLKIHEQLLMMMFMMIVHSKQHKQSTQSTHLGLLVEDQQAKNGLSLSARYPSETIFLPNHFYQALLYNAVSSQLKISWFI